MGKYLPTGDKEQDAKLPGMGGIYNPFNLGMYSYSHNNSVKYTDPDGNIVIALEFGGSGSFDIVPFLVAAAKGTKFEALANLYFDSPVKPEAGVTGTLSTIVALELNMPFNDEGKPVLDGGTFSNREIGVEAGVDIGKNKAISILEGDLFAGLIVGGNDVSVGDLEGKSTQINGSVSVKGMGLFGSKINPESSEGNFYSLGGFVTSDKDISASGSYTFGSTLDNKLGDLIYDEVMN